MGELFVLHRKVLTADFMGDTDILVFLSVQSV